MNQVLTKITMDVSLSPRIYVACLASYNSGVMHGVWIDADLEIEIIEKKIKQMLAKSPAAGPEEYAIHCFEGFHDLSIGEDEHLSSVHEKAMFVVEHGELGANLAAYYGEDLEAAKNALENHYQGEYESELDFASQLFDDCYLNSIPENVQSYIDYPQFCRDIFIQDYFSLDVNGSCHVFTQH